MPRSPSPFLPLVLLAVAAPAQDTEAEPRNPKTKAHEALAMLAGSWQNTCKMAAMPGVPGMEKASEETGSEHTELMCNGLWLKSTLNSSFAGKPFQGIWILGYDPLTSKYRSVWASTQDEPDSIAEGTYDEKTKTWTFHGDSPMGKVRSVVTFTDADHSTELCFVTPPGGSETQCMQMTRTRNKAGTPTEAGASKLTPASKEHGALFEGLGKWDAVVTYAAPGLPPAEEKATEEVVAICGGRWTWSNFRGQMMGMPFEGHALSGYDAAKKQYVSYWFDSMTPNWMRVTGTYDARKKQLTCSGPCIDEQGKPGTVNEVYSMVDADTRSLAMKFEYASGAMDMKINYRRSKL